MGISRRQLLPITGAPIKPHNSLLGKVDGVDGFKTGFTNGSGYNLIVSAKRGGHRIIAVVLGGATGNSRDNHMEDLIERGFDVIAKNAGRSFNPSLALNAATAQRIVQPIPKPKQNYVLQAAYNTQLNNWAVQIGAYVTQVTAQNALQMAQADKGLNVAAGSPQILPVNRAQGMIYRARLTGISHEKAASVCKTLAARAVSCLVVSPN